MTCAKTIPVLEALEGVGVVTSTVESGKTGNKKATQVERLITAGDKVTRSILDVLTRLFQGVLRLWSIESKELALEEPANPAGYTLAGMTYDGTHTLMEPNLAQHVPAQGSRDCGYQ